MSRSLATPRSPVSRRARDNHGRSNGRVDYTTIYYQTSKIPLQHSRYRYSTLTNLDTVEVLVRILHQEDISALHVSVEDLCRGDEAVVCIMYYMSRKQEVLYVQVSSMLYMRATISMLACYMIDNNVCGVIM